MAGSVGIDIENFGIPGKGTTIKKLIFNCMADPSDGSFPAISTGIIANAPGSSTTFTKLIIGWFLHKIIVNPGTTAPTAATDITITDDDGIDFLDGNGTDLIHNTDSKQAYGMIDGVPSLQPITSDLLLTITNNAVNSATFAVKLIFVPTMM